MKSLVAGLVLVVGVMVAWLAPALAAEEETRIDLVLLDDANGTVERALVEFLRDDGEVVTTYQMAESRWIPVAGRSVSEGWGKTVASVRMLAFGCRRTLPVLVEKQTRGALFGGLSPHPVPLTHVYVVKGELRRAAFSALGKLKTRSGRAAQERYAAQHPILF